MFARVPVVPVNAFDIRKIVCLEWTKPGRWLAVEPDQKAMQTAVPPKPAPPPRFLRPGSPALDTPYALAAHAVSMPKHRDLGVGYRVLRWIREVIS
jgi:hypothetical protein